ncbi:hypothetical protein [Dermatobacter hominis]|uniref:hypothetical protein n=1 Tax=Dermatobacter hominis TaxID=2884263 RepID=UPI001D10A10D|nr:hypothetical protein [Dermatobacter hominis]UDY34108.1 hypothetical protein LH044_12220 [Dermatobacter hominis]
MRIGLLLTLVVLVLGSLNFARYDWTGLPINRAPMTATKEVSASCVEQIQPYTTNSGRVVAPVVVDEQQYMNLVEYYRGVPVEDLQLNCLYDPFTFRSGTSWVAHFLPVEEGLALGLTNTAFTLLGVWLVLFALRAQGFSARAVLAAGVVFAVSWNVLMFGTGILVDSSVVAAIALCWFLLAIRRPWFVWPVLFLGYPLKETVGIIVPVILVWAWTEHRDQRRSLGRAFAPAIAAAVAFVVGVAVWRQVLPASDAAWPVTPNIQNTVHNLTDVISLGAFVVGVGPFVVPAFLAYLREARRTGWIRAVVDPAVVGVVVALGICFWSGITVDVTPRLFWIGTPFAATLVARWFSEGRPEEWLARRSWLRPIST